MREVELARFVDATPASVERALSQDGIVEYESSPRVEDVTETNDGTVVTVAGGGRTFDTQFHPREIGYDYEQKDGPLETMETTLAYRPEDQETRVTARSRASTGYPIASLTDRLAAWKRRGELRRTLAGLAADVERRRDCARPADDRERIYPRASTPLARMFFALSGSCSGSRHGRRTVVRERRSNRRVPTGAMTATDDLATSRRSRRPVSTAAGRCASSGRPRRPAVRVDWQSPFGRPRAL